MIQSIIIKDEQCRQSLLSILSEAIPGLFSPNCIITAQRDTETQMCDCAVFNPATKKTYTFSTALT